LAAKEKTHRNLLTIELCLGRRCVNGTLQNKLWNEANGEEAEVEKTVKFPVD
jgi:hypothetical protein